MLRKVKDQSFSFVNGQNFLRCNQTSKRGLIGYNRSLLQGDYKQEKSTFKKILFFILSPSFVLDPLFILKNRKGGKTKKPPNKLGGF